MKVSIITVCLNSEKYIEKTIKSVLEQTYRNIEYIIVDGMSTDNTLNIVEQYKPLFGERLKIISEKDNGLYDAMNKGIKYATGELIGIINSDDWYELDAVENVIKIYKENKNSVIYGVMLYRRNEKISKIQITDYKELGNMMINHPTVFIPKKIYDKVGEFNTKFKLASDYELMLRMLNENISFRHISKIIANFREGGLSTILAEQCENEAMEIKKKYGYGDKPYSIDVNMNIKTRFFWGKLIENINKYNEIYIYGSGTHTKVLIEYLSKNSNIIIKGIIDKNVKEQDRTFLEYKKYNIEEIIDDAKAIIISSITYEYDIYERIKKFKDKIDIIRIYGADTVEEANNLIKELRII